MKRFTLIAILLPILLACQRREESTPATPTPPPATQAAPESAPVTPTAPAPAPATPAAPEPTPPVTAAEPAQTAPQTPATEPAKPATEPTKPATPATPPATPATTKSSGSSGSADEYTVAKGDTLSSIAREHGMNYQDLATWNNIQDPNRIHPGQTLRLTEPSS